MGWHSKDFDLKENELQNFIKMISPKYIEAIAGYELGDQNTKIKITNMWAIIKHGRCCMLILGIMEIVR